MDPTPDRSGVILLRAWLHEGQLVARIQATVGPGQEQHAAVALGMAEIERTVHEWLRDLAATQR